MTPTEVFEDIYNDQDKTADGQDCELGSPLTVGVDVPHWDSFGDDLAPAFEAHGLDVQVMQLAGKRLDPGDGPRERCKVYQLSEPHCVAQGLGEVVKYISKKWGPGKVWFVGKPPINYLQRRGTTPGVLPSRLVGGKPHVLIGCYYVHEKMPVVP